MKVMLVIVKFLFTMTGSMSSLGDIEFDLPVISSSIRLDPRTKSEIFMYLRNETRASMSFVRQVNEYCFRHRLFQESCTRIVGLLSDDIQSTFHGMVHNYVHASFRLNARSFLVS